MNIKLDPWDITSLSIYLELQILGIFKKAANTSLVSIGALTIQFSSSILTSYTPKPTPNYVLLVLT